MSPMHRVQKKLDDGRGGEVSASVLLPEASKREPSTSGRRPLLVLAHGAGAGMEHPFMTRMQQHFTVRGVATVLFNFPYKERGGRAPDRGVVLERCYQSVVEQLRADGDLSPTHLFIGGKSMGGRIATQIAAAGCVSDGILLLGYPLHPAGKPDRLRVAHLPEIEVPLRFIQGTRDSLCNLDLLRTAIGGIKAPTELHIIEGGDHSFKVLKRLGRSEDEVLGEIADRSHSWLQSLL